MPRGEQVGAINLGTGRGASVREVLAAVERATGHAVPITPSPRRAGDPAVLVASPDKAQKLTGWRADARRDRRVGLLTWSVLLGMPRNNPDPCNIHSACAQHHLGDS